MRPIENLKNEKSLPFPIILWILIGLVASGANLMLLIRLSSELLDKQSFHFDQKIIHAVFTYSSPFMDKIMVCITNMGSTYMIAFMLLVGMMWLLVKYKDVLGMLYFFVVVAGGGTINLLLKTYFGRERPTGNRIIEADGFSFPSGHSMGSMLFYGFLGYLIIRSKQIPLRKISWIIALVSVIFLIGISRIYLGVHYPSDVLAGFTAGFIWLSVCIIFLEVSYLFKKRGSFK